MWSEIAKLSASASSELASDSDHGDLLARRLSVVPRQENARAVPRRVNAGAPAPTPVQMDIAETMSEL